ncbi:MAG: DUF58 domain-containing protein [Oscillospiraceae bacterium]|jgi:uncharacterized protein (DUF58 family)|nr:DUF58 domain-containing protein [Oscillospiraceae bacterium]
MKEFRIFYIALAAMMLVLAICYNGKLTAVLLVVFVAVPFLSAIPAFVAFRSISVYANRQAATSIKREPFTLDVTLDNKTPFGLTSVKLAAFTVNGGVTETKTLFADIAPLCANIISLPYTFRFRGQYTAGISEITAYDFLRLFRFKKQVSAFCLITVPPLEIAPPELPSSEGSEQPTKLRALRADVDFSFVREYRDGDSPKKIHWKLSARADDLLVKEGDAEEERSLTVVLDFVPPLTGDGEAFATKFLPLTEARLTAADAVIEAGLAAVRETVDYGFAAHVVFGTDESIRCERVDSSDGYKDLTRLLTLWRTAPANRALLCDKAKDCGNGTAVFITASLGGELAAIMSQSLKGSPVLLFAADKVGEKTEEIFIKSGIPIERMRLYD